MPRRSRSEEVSTTTTANDWGLNLFSGTEFHLGSDFALAWTERTIYESAIEKAIQRG